ncbi:hypothetical protein [Planotetraspora mira]|uniref:Uncharacterized protein n=1 Tax=Planotetraspora mira TaxID=58121 RepID=A0A8J3XAE2_9ACTN|nr:hypothetical protein [Planotetraspora mira]GII33019.1 hypothetical protein Pmi06nite_64610 [Planotetraspora mira]
MSADVIRVPIVEFMVVRSPEPVGTLASYRHFIRDEISRAPVLTHVPPPDAYSVTRVSPIGRLVYDLVFCRGLSDADFPGALKAELLARLEPSRAHCPRQGEDPGPLRLVLEDLEQHAYLLEGEDYYILPDTLRQLAEHPFIADLIALGPVLERALDHDDIAVLLSDVTAVLRGTPVDQVVFENGYTSPGFAEAKRSLFDVLYLLYLLRKWTRVNLTGILSGLRVLHVLEALAFDVVYERVRAGGTDPTDGTILTTLAQYVPDLAGWDPASPVPGMPLVADKHALETLLTATPVIHPLFSRLNRFTRPFNDIKPIGVGDLKVVKQWLRGYTVGEIAHVDTVLRSEFKSRVHRRLEKTEDVFSLTREQQNDVQRDTQTTDRFELKREAEDVVKTDLSANAGLSVNVNYQGTGYNIASSVTGGFAYARSATETARIATTYARDVVDKAVSRIQNRVVQQRTTTQLFETEETNTHTYDNREGDEHVSGLYYWLDKNYRAQVYNFGKRMMFEFVIPEPAAFLVESRLRAFEATLEMPTHPVEPPEETLPQSVLDLDPATIDEVEFRRLSRVYDLTDFTYPAEEIKVDFVNASTGRNYFNDSQVDSNTWQARTYQCRLNAKDYVITNLVVTGYIYYWGANDTSPWFNEQNTFDAYVDGHRYAHDVDNASERWFLTPRVYPGEDAPPLRDQQVSLVLGFWDVAQFDLSVFAELKLSDTALGDWRDKVYQHIRDIEQKRVDAINDLRKQTYQSELSAYKERVAEIRSLAVNEILQGQSEAANRQVILRELKRLCLSMLAREFDFAAEDDILTDLDDTGSRPVKSEFRRFRVTEEPDEKGVPQPSAFYELGTKQLDFPVPIVATARQKGRYVQFLEQAFEWHQLAYICYPYFWATPPRWIELMNRSDRADPFLSEFLQAGSARVLLAVTPKYDCAVQHYLETGEPWFDDDPPVIGDPLFIPLHQELRRRQDDRAGAEPDGEYWDFTLPTSLVYLQDSSTALPPLLDEE